MKRRYVVLAPECFEDAKTAHGVIAYGVDEVVAVVDGDLAGKSVRDVAPHLHSNAPIVSDVRIALAYHPNALLIGAAPRGGALPPSWRTHILEAIAAGLEIVSGLHDMLNEDAEFADAARARGIGIWDVRKPPEVPLFSGAVYDVAAPILLLVGNDCSVGKMTVALELARAAELAGARSAFVPTGQTGIMIAGWGISVDRVIADFAPGATEQLVLQAARENPDVIFVEGQGAINHPAYAPVTLALMFGSGADELLLVVDPVRETIGGYVTPTLGYRELIRLHETIAGTVKPAKVIGVALNTRGLSDARAADEIARARRETQLPADDVVRNGPHELYAAIASQLHKTSAVAAQPGR